MPTRPDQSKIHPAVLAIAVLVAIAALTLAALAITFPEHFREYRLYLTEKMRSLDFTFDALSE